MGEGESLQVGWGNVKMETEEEGGDRWGQGTKEKMDLHYHLSCREILIPREGVKARRISTRQLAGSRV